MRKDLVSIQPISSSFLSYKKDIEILINKLFVESKPYSDVLKKLLIINEPDCLDSKIKTYEEIVRNKKVSDLMKDGYVRLTPKVRRGEHEEIKSYIYVSFDNFLPNRANPAFLDCTVIFDIICHCDAWELDDYQIRPLAIAGYIDGILNSITNQYKKNQSGNISNIKLSGIGEYTLLGCNLTILNEELSMYSLMYRAVHFSEDKQEDKEENA